jgi:hypothetical protein
MTTDDILNRARHAPILEPTPDAPILLRDDTRVTVCSECLCACCWLGELMCQRACDADTTVLTVKELRELGREHESYWLKEEVRA